MSTPDTMTPLLSTPWVDASGKELPVRSLPGLSPECIQALQRTYPHKINPPIQALLAKCCGLADTEIGSIDFTGSCFPQEPCAVFQPCMTMAIDDSGRRWIAELSDLGLPGPVWCMFPDPEVAVYIADDLPTFIGLLHEQAHHRQTLAWLQGLSATAQSVWANRRSSALRPYGAHDVDAEIRGWLTSLPSDAYVYDLRRRSTARGWPYGVAGPSGRLYRCGRLPVFAVATSPTEGWRLAHPDTTMPVRPVAAPSVETNRIGARTGRHRPRVKPLNTVRRCARRLCHRGADEFKVLQQCA